MTIWVDADSIPREAREYIARRSRPAEAPDTREVLAVFVADKAMPLPAGRLVRRETVASGADAADDWICDHAQTGDIIVTRDIPLAARAVALGAIVINDRGDRWTADTVRERLSLRDRAKELRDLGLAVAMDRSRSYGPREARSFAAALDKAIYDAISLAWRTS